MPPEPKTKLKRRSSRRDTDEYKFDGGHSRELELKRSRGEVSCAECRRLKIKCDRQVPCTSCQRRGCAALCPNGSLATGQGTRFVLAATEHLHRRISRLSGRIRELEDALASIHSKYAPDGEQPHPLLENDWLWEVEEGADDDELEPGSNRGRKISKLPSDLHARIMSVGIVDSDAMDESNGGGSLRRNSREKRGTGDVIDALGTLSISNHGISRFFGPTGGSESLLIATLSSTESPQTSSSNQLRNSSSPTIAFERETSSLSPPSSHKSQITNTSTQLSVDSVFSSNTTSLSTGSASTLDPRITLFSHNFPFTPLALPPAQIQELIESYLPTYERARELVNIYFEQVAWIFRGVSKEQLDGEMVGVIYARKYARECGENVKEGGYDSDEHFVKLTNSRGKQQEHVSEEIPKLSSATSSTPPVGTDYSGPHDLALLFIVFALGALVEPYPSTSDSPNGSSPNSNLSTGIASRPSPSSLGEHYHQLAQASLSLQPVLEKPSIVTIQSLHVMSIYNAMSGEGTANPASDTSFDSNASSGESKTGQSETSMEMTWSLITMAAHLGQTIGLHRDSERWGLSPKMVQRRRILFWDLFVADVWQSLNTGRPPSFSLAYVDCNFPQYEGVNMKDANSQGSDKSSPAKGLTGVEKSKRDGYAFEIWQFRFASECVAEVVSRTLTAETPTYATIMELDRKVREFPLPEDFMDRGAGSSAKDAGLGGHPNTFPSASTYANPPTAESEGQDSDMSLSFMKCVLDHVRETVLMYIHRSFFAQAIIDQPTNPLKSVYAPSFLAAYRGAATILKSVREQFILWPNSCARFWTMWTFAFSAAVVFGTVVTRGPRSPLAASAMTELDQACILFSKAAIYSKRATKALPILTTLREKARLALAAAQSQNPEKPNSDGEFWNIKKEETDPNDELSIFAGHTRLVSANNVVPASSENSSAVQSANASGFVLTPIGGPHTGLRQHRSSSQLRRQYYTDVDMEPPSRYDSMYNRRSSQSHQHPAPPLRPLHHRASFSGYQDNDSHSPSIDGWYGQNARHREDHDMHPQHHHPPTISIPSAPAPVPSSMDERSPHQPMQFNYSYDRSSRSGLSPIATTSTYSWSPHSPYPSRHSSSPVRLTHPQYGQASSQAQSPMHTFHNSPLPAQMYSGPGVTGFCPPVPPHPLPMHPPGNAALADLGLASRDSRLDERWSSFMQDSGLLDEVDFGRGR
ncbi:fungal-specific transcription factor domain-containing protein [Lentinula aff. detonsa]|nr:fungal-specific transcription factor domain-containing protein [Lentinula aff. detonsa]